MKLTVSAIQQTYTLSGRNACALGSHLSLLITLLQPTLFCVGVSCPLISSFAVLILPSPDGERELTIKSYDHNQFGYALFKASGRATHIAQNSYPSAGITTTAAQLLKKNLFVSQIESSSTTFASMKQNHCDSQKY